ncbi:MAG: 50S ribosomal protein L15 [Candidatus Marinimicrobia bacterium]|jgi:large subunit ribosomal protein L15|nr:50S ribosomal protein L15 [Pseudomonadota bacterium]MAR97233.1 50S ribosomal protein L15 [Candidatus Neomarinimicrobiota bacterium]MBO70016.1 50S ribosomal protein L15 [Candidatus Neomarinimicrobiota bacterium]MEC8703341.1 50S ribosomal protein L15 [Candidatus Neomarinimicrobiota bacterium]|tara:strand:- start:1542 stop:1982 length:441 start_codon:yes stop_codon:yes gene_type:complete
MKLGDLKPAKGATHSKKRVGRGHGSGLGRNAGRGDKGYHSRSGSKHRPWFEGGQMPLHRRVPKRGFSNFLFKKEFQIVNLSDLNIIQSEEINPAVMKENGLVKYSLRPIKILGDGEIDKKMNVTASAFSSSAKSKIEKAGGTVEVQ